MKLNGLELLIRSPIMYVYVGGILLYSTQLAYLLFLGNPFELPFILNFLENISYLAFILFRFQVRRDY